MLANSITLNHLPTNRGLRRHSVSPKDVTYEEVKAVWRWAAMPTSSLYAFSI